MYKLAEQRLARLIQQGNARLLGDNLIGLEKESLRVTPQGKLAQTPHPAALGAALTHPYITTDYSEALAELITPPSASVETALDFLRDTQRFVYQHLDNEMLWATSMPCVVAGETSIPIAKYGSSNPGMMKTIYRRGLGHRYGRVMQTIAGVHFNFSCSDAFWAAFQELQGDRRSPQAFRSEGYFALIRNQQRFGWLVPYLFGASPAVCKSFIGGRATDLEEFDDGTYYQPYATSLRMGNIGYQNNQEAKHGVKACYDNLDAYIHSLLHAIETPYPPYEKIGVKVQGEYEQLNTHLLQIENEYYSTIRPKQILEPMEKPVHALKHRGVRYVELRSVDVNAFEPLGIDAMQGRFLQAFLVFCLLHDSPLIDREERDAIDHNELAAAHRGRDPHLHLQRSGKAVALRAWAREILTAMQGVCEVLDASETGQPYGTALASQMAKVEDPERTPSARMLAEMSAAREGFFSYALRKSREHQAYFAALALAPAREAEFTRLAEDSWRQQRQLEADTRESLDSYLQRYFAQAL